MSSLPFDTLSRMRDEHKSLVSDIEGFSTRAVAEDRDLTEAEAEELQEKATRATVLADDIEYYATERKREAAVAAIAPLGPKTRALTGDATQDTAVRLVDGLHRSKQLSDESATVLEGMVRHGETEDTRYMRALVAATGTEAYFRAFRNYMIDPATATLRLSDEERAAMRAMYDFRKEFRAVSEGGTSSVMLPVQIDPALRIVSNKVQSPMRSLATTKAITNNIYRGVTTTGVQAAWHSELAPISEVDPTFVQPEITAYAASSWINYSWEAQEDIPGLVSDLGNILSDAWIRLTETSFVTGSGSGQPFGLLNGITSSQKVASTTADTVVAADVLALQAALPVRWQAGATWQANLVTLNTLGALNFSGTGSDARFPELAQNLLLRRPVHENSLLTAAGTTASAGNDFPLVYGDIANAYTIVERIGFTLVPIPVVIDQATGNPTGSSGYILWGRVGGGVTVADAVRVLTA